MPVTWTMRRWLKDMRGITRASEVSELIFQRTGYKISKQAVCDLLNGPPKMIRLETMQAFCDTFYCRLIDFCEVMPVAASKSRQKPALFKDVGPPVSAIKADTGTPLNSPKDPDLSGGETKVDLASLFPDARKFSSLQ